MKKVKKLMSAIKKPPSWIQVAGYARVSSKKDAMLRSLSAQVSHYSRIIQSRPGWKYVGVYADEALTGTKDTRPEFQRMLADCRAGKINLIITKSITRFARNTVTLLETVRELKELNVDVFFERENIHSLSGDGELMLSILASFAQEESRSVSENNKWRIRKNFAEGIPCNGTIMGYRLVEEAYQVMPEEAEIVRMIFKDYMSGMSQVAIADKLNALGSKSRFGNSWSKSTIRGILMNKTYTGELTLQKTFLSDHLEKKTRINRGELPMYTVQNAHESIISEEMFNDAQEEMARRIERYNPPTTTPRSYPFSGLLQCDGCQKNYRRKIVGYAHYKRPVWICATYNAHGKQACASKQIPENILMETTAAMLEMETFSEDALRKRIAKIEVHNGNKLIFQFTDGTSKEAAWQDHSRRDSWGEQQRQIARARQLKRNRGETT